MEDDWRMENRRAALGELFTNDSTIHISLSHNHADDNYGDHWSWDMFSSILETALFIT